MQHSDRHKLFAYELWYDLIDNEQDVLDHPEDYLGPNYKELLNCWFYWGSLSDEQRDVFRKRYWDRHWAVDHETHKKARKTSIELAKEVIDPRIVSYLNSRERELIAAHLYIERNIPFTFLPLIFDL